MITSTMNEALQFALVLAGILVAAAVWYLAIYLPGRTMEDWRDKRPEERGAEPKPKDPADVA